MLRCEHGMIRGFCVVAECPHYEGPHRKNGKLPRACESCGEKTSRRHCTKCSRKPEVDRAYSRARGAA